MLIEFRGRDERLDVSGESAESLLAGNGNRMVLEQMKMGDCAERKLAQKAGAVHAHSGNQHERGRFGIGAAVRLFCRTKCFKGARFGLKRNTFEMSDIQLWRGRKIHIAEYEGRRLQTSSRTSHFGN